MTVAHMSRSMTAPEFMGWARHYQRDPWGESRGDWRVGNLCALIANMMSRRGARHLAAKDFMPQFRERAKRKRPRFTREQTKRMFRSAVAGLGGTGRIVTPGAE